ncbi:MAG TPA: hypothetical protein DEO64_16075 [Alcaligenes faecalis]|nr:hypothetical protein [Alcaligenes faecalis]
MSNDLISVLRADLLMAMDDLRQYSQDYSADLLKKALFSAPVGAEPEGLSLEVRTLGSYGKAFDLPGNRRAYTYDHQPGNVEASRLGTACQQAVASSAGDYIDRGLSLLKELQALGFGVFEVDSSRWHAAPVPSQPDLTQQTLDDVMAGIPARDAEIAALRKEIEALQAAQAQQPVSGADGLPIERVLIDGTAYELPSAVAAELLRLHLEILGAEQELAALAQQDADKEDAALAEMVHAMFRSGNSVPVTRITIDRKQYDAAIDAARKEQT